MAEEMIEDVAWESDEAEDWESDEAIAEAEDSAEDIGERAQRRRRRGRSFRPGRGVQGIAVRGQDGRVRNVPFPTKLATAAETNRGLASQEVARRALDARLDRLEARFRGQQKNDSAASGLVSLALGGGLTAFAAIQSARQPGGSFLGNLASAEATRLAAVTSATQLTTSVAKLAINGRYHRSGIGIAADIFALLQIGLFAVGSFSQPTEYRYARNVADARVLMMNVRVGTRILIGEDNNLREEAEVVTVGDNQRDLRIVR